MFGAQLLTSRRFLGLTQQELAIQAGISLATLQNIERGRANPSLATIEALTRQLGLMLSLVPEAIDWELLIAAGVPLRCTEERCLPPSDMELVAREVRKATQQELSEREKRAIAAFLMAIVAHFPTVANRWYPTAILRQFRNHFDDPEVIKLKRIATAVIATYL